MQLLNMVPSRNLAGLTTLRSEFDPEKNGYSQNNLYNAEKAGL